MKKLKGAHFLEGLGLIILALLLGETLSTGLHLPLPGNLVGLLLLFFALTGGIIKLEQVEQTAAILLDNLMLFFIPINVGLVASRKILAGEWPIMLAAILVSTLVVMAVTGKLVELVEGRRKDAHVE